MGLTRNPTRQIFPSTTTLCENNHKNYSKYCKKKLLKAFLTNFFGKQFCCAQKLFPFDFLSQRTLVCKYFAS